MLRSLFSGISGLRAHQQMMDVTGNNIANVNTTGYKSSQAVFQDTLNQMLKAPAGQDNLFKTDAEPSPAQQQPKPQPTLAQRQAEQLLGSAEREERDVQSKKQKQNRPEPPPGGKDW